MSNWPPSSSAPCFSGEQPDRGWVDSIIFHVEVEATWKQDPRVAPVPWDIFISRCHSTCKCGKGAFEFNQYDTREIDSRQSPWNKTIASSPLLPPPDTEEESVGVLKEGVGEEELLSTTNHEHHHSSHRAGGVISVAESSSSSSSSSSSTRLRWQ